MTLLLLQSGPGMASTGMAPTNTAVPVISGTTSVGSTLTTTNGTWTGTPTPTYTYQWKRGGTNIGGATSSTYLLVTADAGTTITVTVTATNTAGSASATSAGVGPIAATDPYWTSVKLLMGFNGANASTGAPGMTDESSAAHGNASVTNQAQISTAQSQFGGSSLLLDGTNDLVSFADHADWNLSNQQFTLECWIRPVNVSSIGFIIDQWQGPNNGWTFYQNSAALEFHCGTTGSNDVAIIVTGNVLTANTWHALAVDFNGIKYRMYLNGTMVGSSTTLQTFFNSASALCIGANSSSTFSFNGWIDELRLTVGVARYASDGGYTVTTTAFPRS